MTVTRHSRKPASFRRALAFLILTLALPAAVAAAAPANDVHPGMTIESLPFTHTTDTTEATIYALEPSPTCAIGVTNSVWYSFTPSADVEVTADTAGSDYDTVIDVFTGTVNADFSEAALLSVGCNDDAGAITSQLAFAAVASERYLIRVSGRDGLGGQLTFHLTETVTDAAMAQPTALSSLLTIFGLLLILSALATTARLSRRDRRLDT
jgi:hypothetical protein